MPYSGPVIDIDVHNQHNPGELQDYLPEYWHSLVASGAVSVLPVHKHFPPAHNNARRLDTYTDDGNVPGRSIPMMQQQVLDPLNVERAILTYGVGFEVAHENPYLGAAMAAALNDWQTSCWLNAGEDRLFGAISVATQLPAEAAAEIRRMGEHPRMVEVLFADAGVGLPFGHPVYHPIYDAAVEYGLPVGIHFGANLFGGQGAISAGGLPNNYFEYYTILNQAAMHHASSLITHGVFEKFPTLRFVLLETGFTWLPWLAAGLDAEYDRLRRESPWVKRLPSEYLRDHLAFSTQPFEGPMKGRGLQSLLESFDGFRDILMFSTDYPHWDADEPDYVARFLPDEWHEDVFYGNARSLFRWPSLVPES